MVNRRRFISWLIILSLLFVLAGAAYYYLIPRFFAPEDSPAVSGAIGQGGEPLIENLPIFEEPPGLLESVDVSGMNQGEAGDYAEVEEKPRDEQEDDGERRRELALHSLEPEVIDQNLPFSSQAPQFSWDDPRQQDGCEEISVLMAMAWVRREKQVPASVWEERITSLADFSQEKYGEHRDISVRDVVEWLFKDYFSYNKVRVSLIESSAQIVAELENGNLLLVPLNGQELGNPNFTPPGPEHHFAVIKGYDYRRQEFIAHDPGTRYGANYRYPEDVLYQAIRSYPTGYHEKYDHVKKEAIIVSR